MPRSTYSALRTECGDYLTLSQAPPDKLLQGILVQARCELPSRRQQWRSIRCPGSILFLRASSCSLWRTSSSSNTRHRPQRLHELRVIDVMPVFFLFNCSNDEINQLLARSAFTQQPFDVVFDSRKQTGADHSVGGQANAAAMTAERLGDRVDESDLARFADA